MAVVIRLQRTGKPRQPYFRVVAIEKARGPKGKALEILGSYNPRKDNVKEKVSINVVSYQRWIGCGAKPSETVCTLVRPHLPAAAKQTTKGK